jgi:hypothetical protein
MKSLINSSSGVEEGEFKKRELFIMNKRIREKNSISIDASRAHLNQST